MQGSERITSFIFVFHLVKPVGKPGAVVPHAGFDEQRQETYYEQD